MMESPKASVPILSEAIIEIKLINGESRMTSIEASDHAKTLIPKINETTPTASVLAEEDYGSTSGSISSTRR